MKELKHETMEIPITPMAEVAHAQSSLDGPEIQTTLHYVNSVEMGSKKAQKDVMMVTQTTQTDVVVYELLSLDGAVTQAHPISVQLHQPQPVEMAQLILERLVTMETVLMKMDEVALVSLKAPIHEKGLHHNVKLICK